MIIVFTRFESTHNEKVDVKSMRETDWKPNNIYAALFKNNVLTIFGSSTELKQH